MKNNFALSIIAILMFSFSASSLLAQRYENRYGDLEYRKWRLTLINPIGTNGIAAPRYTAKYSINLLGGYHGGLNGLEIGTLYNYNKEYASGFQIAGLVNATSGYAEGVGIAGLINYAGSDLSGIQIAGFGNISKSNIEGLQAAGALNYASGDLSGLQGSFGANIARGDVEGAQISGLLNISQQTMSGLQITGGANVGLDNMEGLMISGVFNAAKGDASGLFITGGGNIASDNMEGLMISTLFNVSSEYSSGLMITGGLNYSRYQEGLMISAGANITQEMEGAQFGGFLNYATTATGLQVGIINIASEFEGASVGLLSLYGNGRKNFDVRYSDAGFTDIGITTGTHRVYNMAILGYNTSFDRNVYRFGLGVGLEKNINDSFRKIESEDLFVNQEFTVMHHFEEDWSKKTNLIFSYKYLIGNRFNSGLSLYGGPTYNIQVTRVNSANDYTWYSLWSPEWNGRKYRMWVGFTVGVRFFKQKNLPLLDDYDFEYGWD
ncbi:MAG: hypothetical protein RIC57_03165 [Balneola sp.]|tara:strand:+ start:215117 stop:216598 length:1482 start_codon:yes stop_codon:yes gene_type:complete